jgi:thiol-disulfide isomerase/thioredoxin
VAGVALVIVLLAACSGDDPGSSKAQCPKPSGLISIGEPIPGSCQLERLDGSGLLRLEDLKGKPAVINFWATWCTFCIDEMPAIEEATLPVRNRVAIIGADLLGVDGETRGAAETFAKRTGVTYDLVYDRGGVLFGNFSGQLLLPVTIFVKGDGIVAHRQFGPLTENTLTAMLSKYLGVR